MRENPIPKAEQGVDPVPPPPQSSPIGGTFDWLSHRSDPQKGYNTTTHRQQGRRNFPFRNESFLEEKKFYGLEEPSIFIGCENPIQDSSLIGELSLKFKIPISFL